VTGDPIPPCLFSPKFPPAYENVFSYPAYLECRYSDESKIAAIGFCFGGATSLALAYTGAPLAGVVTFHGALLPPPAGAGEKTKAKFLILHGALDPLVAKDAVDAFLKGMNEGKFDFQFVEYSGAVHAFTNPDAGKFGVKGLGYNAEAASRSWIQMQLFFHEIFGS
jgi:dienelactone hydrolase